MLNLNFYSGFCLTKGTSPKNKENSYDEAKVPIRKFWQWSKMDYDTAFGHYVDDDYWIGAVPAYGVIVVDVDKPESISYLISHMDEFNNVFKTPNGYHVYFKMDKYISGGTSVPVMAGFKVTFRNHKNYVIVRSEAGERDWIKTGELQPLPECFQPNKKETSEKVQEFKRLAMTEAQNNGQFSPATFYIVAKLRAESTKGNKHFARQAAGLESGNYRLPETDLDFIVSVVRSVSTTPDKAEKTFRYFFQKGLENNAKTWKAPKDNRKPFEILKEFVLREKRLAKNIKNETLRSAGISPNAYGSSAAVVKKIDGKTVRVHEVEEFDVLREELQTETKKAQVEQFAHTRTEESTSLSDAIQVILKDSLDTFDKEPVPDFEEYETCTLILPREQDLKDYFARKNKIKPAENYDGMVKASLDYINMIFGNA